MKTKLKMSTVSILLFLVLAGCSSPEQKLATYMNDGFEALKKNEPDQALGSFRKALEIDAKSNQALWGLILTFEQQGNLRKVFDLTRQLVEQDPSNVEAHFKMANLYLMSNMEDYLDEQLSILDKLTKNNPDLIALRAEKALKSAEPEQARQLAELALKFDGNNMSALMTLAKISGRNDDIDQALVYVDKALVKHADQNSLYLAKISLLKDGFKLDKIPEVYEKLIELNPMVFQFKKDLALFLVQQKKYVRAEKLLKEILKAHPDNLESQVGLAKLTLATKDKVQAKKLFQQFVDANPDSMPLKFAHYNFCKEIGEFGQAKKMIIKMIEEAKIIDDKLKASAFYADDLLTLGQRTEAVKLVDEVINKDPKNRDGLMVKAKLAMFDQRFISAIGIYRNILGDFPNDLVALIALGKAYEYSGTLELANESYFQAYQESLVLNEVREGYISFLLKNHLNERAEQLVQEWVNASPNNPYYRMKLALIKIKNGKFDEADNISNKMIAHPKLIALGYQLQGEILNAKGNFEAANKSFLNAFSLEKENTGLLSKVVDAYLKVGKENKAIDLLNGIDERSSIFYEAQLILAKLNEKNAPDQSAKIYLELIKTFPKREEAYINLSNSFAGRGITDQAETVIETCISRINSNHFCQLTLAERFVEQKLFDKAIAIYQQEFERNPSDILIRNNLASMLIEHAKTPQTKQYAFYLSQVFANADEPMLNDTYGWAAYNSGNISEAVRALEYATKKAPNQGLFFFHLALAYQANNQYELAKKAKLKSITLNADSHSYSLESLKSI